MTNVTKFFENFFVCGGEIFTLWNFSNFVGAENNLDLDSTSFIMYHLNVEAKWLVTYYTAKDGSSTVEKYLKDLPVNERAKALAFIGLLKE
ncbi:MAG: hypothetical protein FWH12_05655 [Treponema sp.]|nr:hypothetical protein [Treponema sp.]